MAIIAVETPRTSALIKHQYDPSSSYTNKVVSVTIPAGGMKLGTVLDKTGAVIAVASTVNAAYVVCDPEIANKPAGAAKVLCLARGPVTLDAAQLVFGTDVNDATKKNAVIAVLEAKGIVTEPETL